MSIGTNNIEPIYFASNSYGVINNDLHIPIPDGYHYSDNGTGGNKNWFYIVKDDVSLDEDHINAKPWSFGISSTAIGAFPFDSEKIAEIKALLTFQGYFNSDISIVECVCSSHCGFLYQIFTDPNDATYNKIKGFVFTGEKLYQFHIFVNYDSEIAHSRETIEEFQTLAHSWMNKAYIDNDEFFENSASEFGQEFKTITPDKSLYPHYYNLGNTSDNPSFGAITTITNASGMEYQFIPFSDAIENEDTSEKTKEIYKRIASSDKGHYDMNRQIKEMQLLFHVSKNGFNPKHDRESEIEKGYIHKAYMMSALRSFAWTVCDYCNKNNVTPKSLSSEICSQIADFIASRNWLNYDGNEYCKGLCGCQDLHVFYVPDAASPSDLAILLPDEEDYERVRKMKERFPAYRELLSETASLDLLREDLKYIYPAVHSLYKNLKANRNYNEELTGAESDIVYAWCSLAFTAKEPFFMEDGPTRCFFTYNENEELDNCSDEHIYDEYICDEDEEIFILLDDELVSCELDAEQIFLPQNIKTIGYRAFFDKEDLKEVVLNEGLEVIKYDAFYNTGLVSLKCPESLRKIDSDAFNNCRNLKEINLNEGLETIGIDAFNDTAIEKVYIPDSVIEIGTDAFPRHVILVGKKGSVAESYARENDSFFIAYDTDETVEEYTSIDDFDIEDGVITKYNGTSVNVVLPPDIKEIYKFVFFDSKIESIKLNEGLERIGEYAFSESSIKSITIPSSVKFIEDGAFSYCEHLKTVKLNEGLERIDEYAFRKCPIKSITIPSSVKFIENGAFGDCKYLKTVNLNEGLDRIGEYAFSESSIKSITIPSSVKIIENSAFEDCKYLKTVNLNEGVEKISHAAFRACPITEITFPESLKIICDSAFSSCAELSKVIFKNGVLKIGSFCFNDCSKLKSVELPESLVSYDKTFSFPKTAAVVKKRKKPVKIENEYVDINSKDYKEFLIDGNVLKYFIGSKKKVIVPDGITVIDDYAFSDETLDEITLPGTLKRIGKGAFKNFAISSEEFVLPDNLESIDSYAFERIGGLLKTVSKIVIPNGITTIKRKAFYKANIVIIDLGKNIIKIEPYAFSYSKIQSCNIPNGIELIDDHVFENCRNLSELKLPSGLKKIGKYAFNFCDSLNVVELPDSVEEIGAWAFSKVTIEEISIPSAVKILSNYMFDDCKNLKNITLHEGLKKIEKCAFARTAIESLKLPQSVNEFEISKDDYADKDFLKSTEFIVYKDSYSEQWAKENADHYKVIKTAQQEAEERKHQEELRKAEEERIAREKALAEERTKREAEERERQRIEEEKRRAAEQERLRIEAEERRKAEEARIAEEKRIAAQRKAEYEKFLAEKEALLKTIAENKGLFGEKARNRKEAKAKLEEVNEKLNGYQEFLQ